MNQILNEVRCFFCEGSAVDPRVEPVCCGRPQGHECCGNPEPNYQPCEVCAGTGSLDPVKYAQDRLSGKYDGLDNIRWTASIYHKKVNMIKVDKRLSKFTELKPYCHHAKESDFAEVCEWSNGEGFDFTLSTRGDQKFSLTYGEWDALQALVAYKE